MTKYSNVPYQSFISIVNVIQYPQEVRLIGDYLRQLFTILDKKFSDFEFILVNNVQEIGLDDEINALPACIKKNIYVLQLSSRVHQNNAIIAGLDRANGDYTIVFEFQFADQPELILALFAATRQHFDIAYLRANNRKASWNQRLLHHIFYKIFTKYSDLKLDDRAHNTRIISRRALNSILKLRENLRFMKAIYSVVGYPTTAIEVAVPLENGTGNFSEQFRTSLVAITSFTSFLRSLLLWIFLFSFGFLILVVFNALLVKMTNYDLSGTYHEALTGWTFLVVLISVFFAVTCLNLYIMSIYLSNIYFEIKQRPLYIIEAVKRF